MYDTDEFVFQIVYETASGVDVYRTHAEDEEHARDKFGRHYSAKIIDVTEHGYAY